MSVASKERKPGLPLGFAMRNGINAKQYYEYCHMLDGVVDKAP